MTWGTIIRIDRDHGVGTIRPDDGTRTIGFHHSGVVGRAFDRLEEGQRVAFDRHHDPYTPGRILARNIRRLTHDLGEGAGQTP
jgi:cold shock CspA family protein